MATIKRGPAKPALPAKPRIFEIVWSGGACTTTTYGEAIVVFNALSRDFLHVVVLKRGEIMMAYDNR